jgi:hypothetical protein
VRLLCTRNLPGCSASTTTLYKWRTRGAGSRFIKGGDPTSKRGSTSDHENTTEYGRPIRSRSALPVKHRILPTNWIDL